MKKQRAGPVILIILILATLAFIWGNSMQSVTESQGKSLSVLAEVKPLLEVFVGRGNVTNHLVRKLAHFTEYSTLGCELALLLLFIRKITLQPIIDCLFFGMAVALTDETIQIFTGRGSQVQDVWLDFAGSCTGILFVLLIRLLITTPRRKHKPNHVSK